MESSLKQSKKEMDALKVQSLRVAKKKRRPLLFYPVGRRPIDTWGEWRRYV